MRKPRSITRANRKKGFPVEPPLTPYGMGGYYDPTSYLAIQNIEREIKRQTGRSRRCPTRNTVSTQVRGGIA